MADPELGRRRARSVDHRGEHPPHGLAVLRVDVVEDGVLDDFLGFVAEQALERRAPVPDRPARVHDHDDVERVVDERAEVLLALAQGVHRPAPLGHVHHRPLDHRLGGRAFLDQVHVLQDPHRAAVLAAQAHLGVRQRALLPQSREERVAVAGFRVEVPAVAAPHLLAGGVAQHPGEGLVAVDDPAVERRAVHAGQVALEEIAKPRLGHAARLLDLALPGDVRGDPGRAEQVALGVPHGRRLEGQRDELAVLPAVAGLVLDVALPLEDPFERLQVLAGLARDHPVGHGPPDHFLGRAPVDAAGGRIDERPAAEGIRGPDELVGVLDELAVALLARSEAVVRFAASDGANYEPASRPRQAPRRQAGGVNASGRAAGMSPSSAASR